MFQEITNLGKGKDNYGSKRNKKGSTDSIEYAHFVWQKNYKQDYCKTYVI